MRVTKNTMTKYLIKIIYKDYFNELIQKYCLVALIQNFFRTSPKL